MVCPENAEKSWNAERLHYTICFFSATHRDNDFFKIHSASIIVPHLKFILVI